MGRTPPHLEGNVIDVFEMKMRKTGEWSGTVLKGLIALLILPFRPLMILMGLIFGLRSTAEIQEVIVLRVEDAATGHITEARIETDMRGAGVRLGDHVALWGQYRGGVLIVSRGYNYNAGAEIRMSGSIGLTQVVQILAIVVIVIFLLALCSFMSSFRVFTPF